MKKTILTLLISIATIAIGGNFRSTTSSTTGQKVNSGYTSVVKLNVINPNSGTGFLKLYDVNYVPSYTNTPTMTFQIDGNKEIYLNVSNNVNSFIYGCYIRSTTGYSDTANVSPTIPFIIEINTQ